MGLFSRRKPSEAHNGPVEPRALGPTQVEMMVNARIPVFLSKLHAEHPPRWLSVYGDRLESVVGLESEEYMDDASNHEVWSVGHYVEAFPFVTDFLNAARPGQTALFVDQSGAYALEES